MRSCVSKRYLNGIHFFDTPCISLERSSDKALARTSVGLRISNDGGAPNGKNMHYFKNGNGNLKMYQNHIFLERNERTEALTTLEFGHFMKNACFRRFRRRRRSKFYNDLSRDI